MAKYYDSGYFIADYFPKDSRKFDISDTEMWNSIIIDKIDNGEFETEHRDKIIEAMECEEIANRALFAAAVISKYSDSDDDDRAKIRAFTVSIFNKALCCCEYFDLIFTRISNNGETHVLSKDKDVLKMVCPWLSESDIEIVDLPDIICKCYDLYNHDNTRRLDD